MKLPDYITPIQWADWLEYRLNDVGRKKFGERAQRAFLRKCEALHQLGYDVPRLIDHAMDIGWLTIWPRDDMMRVRRQRETTVTVLADVKVDKEIARANIAAMRERTGK